MNFFLVLAVITLVMLLVIMNNNDKNKKFFKHQLKSFKTKVSIEEIEIPENKERITIKILFYPESEEEKEIRVSVHSFLGDEWYTYYQDAEPFQSNEIEPQLVSSNTNYKDVLENYRDGNIQKEKIIYTSNENISYTQTFNTIPGVSKVYILMKFTGNYKITIT
jgi:hypothetical protein